MTGRRRLAFWALVGLQAAFPLGMIGWNEVQLARGTEVRLLTAPVDPVDLFRGRYVRLGYEISSVQVFEPVERGDTVYVVLTEAGDVWVPERVSTTRPPADEVFIRGRVTGEPGGGRVSVEYGIETYYADEDEARRLERELGRRVVVVASLGADGKARIKGIEVRG